ncbi:MAG: NADH-ubiquinone oxidoreductase-F iron-sulfur binding region domain-containing protein [Solirubrobacteraceae bacterium]
MSLPRLLRGVEPGRMSYDDHRHVHGELTPAAHRRGHGAASAVVAELKRSGLRGRGGGAFPLAAKLEAVRRSRRAAVVVVNATEGEPMSFKDRTLVQALPHLVIDGAICCAAALATDTIVFAFDESSDEPAAALATALHERPEFAGRMTAPEVVRVPEGYVTGHETSVVNFLNTGTALPTRARPRISERGFNRRPTLMSNAETLAHAALIVRHGADWFRELGSDDEPGSALVTLSGAVRCPGVYEVEHGAQLATLIDAAEGQSAPLRAFLFGGYAGGWVDAADATRARLSEAGLRPLSASFGAGIVVALPSSACPVAEVTRVADWMAAESAGQCGPCVNGLAAIADTLASICDGRPGRDAESELRRFCALVTGRGACAHPDGAARFVSSALSVFAAEIEDHARHGPCDACDRRAVLSTPEHRSPVP